MREIKPPKYNFGIELFLGYLSRSGICPNPTSNFVRKDTRLNFYGIGYILPGDEEPACTLSECADDGECAGDKKCCKNYCGGQVCTVAGRELILLI